MLVRPVAYFMDAGCTVQKHAGALERPAWTSERCEDGEKQEGMDQSLQNAPIGSPASNQLTVRAKYLGTNCLMASGGHLSEMELEVL